MPKEKKNNSNNAKINKQRIPKISVSSWFYCTVLRLFEGAMKKTQPIESKLEKTISNGSVFHIRCNRSHLIWFCTRAKVIGVWCVTFFFASAALSFWICFFFYLVFCSRTMYASVLTTFDWGSERNERREEKKRTIKEIDSIEKWKSTLTLSHPNQNILYRAYEWMRFASFQIYGSGFFLFFFFCRFAHFRQTIQFNSIQFVFVFISMFVYGMIHSMQ